MHSGCGSRTRLFRLSSVWANHILNEVCFVRASFRYLQEHERIKRYKPQERVRKCRSSTHWSIHFVPIRDQKRTRLCVGKL